jgi:hypothetical protein
VVIHVFKDEQRSQQLGSLGLNTEVKGEVELITDRSWQLQTSAKIIKVSTVIKGVSPIGSVSFDGDVDFSVSESAEDSPLSPPTKNSRLTGQEIGELRGLIMNAFPEGDLAETLKIHLNLDYNAIRQGGGYRTIVFNLITNYFEPRGETANLVNSLIKERPNDCQLYNFYTTHYQ